jgi:hypothetical protein
MLMNRTSVRCDRPCRRTICSWYRPRGIAVSAMVAVKRPWWSCARTERSMWWCLSTSLSSTSVARPARPVITRGRGGADPGAALTRDASTLPVAEAASFPDGVPRLSAPGDVCVVLFGGAPGGSSSAGSSPPRVGPPGSSWESSMRLAPRAAACHASVGRPAWPVASEGTPSVPRVIGCTQAL